MTPTARYERRVERLQSLIERKAPIIIIAQACMLVVRSAAKLLSEGILVSPEEMNDWLGFMKVYSSDSIIEAEKGAQQEMKDHPEDAE